MKKLDILRNCLQQIIDNMDAGNTNLDDSQCEEVLELINRATVADSKYSKYQACKYLGVSRSTFDNWVRNGKVPQGRRQQGFKELFWLKKDLDDAKNKINNS